MSDACEAAIGADNQDSDQESNQGSDNSSLSAGSNTVFWFLNVCVHPFN